MADTKRILIGEIATSHGVKGLVKLRSFVEDMKLFERATLHTGEQDERIIALRLKNAMKDHWLAEIEGVTEKNGADALRGTRLWIDRAALPESGDDEYYHEDLKGLTAIDGAGATIGTVTDIVNYGASDLLDIKPATGQSFYVPFTDDTVLAIDLDAGTITVAIPETI